MFLYPFFSSYHDSLLSKNINCLISFKYFQHVLECAHCRWHTSLISRAKSNGKYAYLTSTQILSFGFAESFGLRDCGMVALCKPITRTVIYEIATITSITSYLVLTFRGLQLQLKFFTTHSKEAERHRHLWWFRLKNTFGLHGWYKISAL